MKRTIIWAVAVGALLAIANSLMNAESSPTTEDRVRMQLVSGGWANVQVTRHERFLLTTAAKDGRTGAFLIDLRTGQLRTCDDHGD